MGVIEAIKKGFEISTKLFKLILVLFAFNLIWAFVSMPFTPPQPTPAIGGPVPPALRVINFIFVLISIFILGGTLRVIKDFIKEGALKIKEFASFGLKYYLRLLGIGLIIILFILIVAMIASVVIAATEPLKNVFVTIIARIVAIAIGAAGLYGVLLVIMSPYIMIAEDRRIMESIKTSISFVKPIFWKVVGLLVLLILILLGIAVILGVLMGLVTYLLPPAAANILVGIVTSALNSYVSVLMWASIMSFYLGRAAADKVTEEPIGPPE